VLVENCMRKIILLMTVVTWCLIAGCGVHKSSQVFAGRQVEGINDTTETIGTITKFKSKSNPRVSFIQHSLYAEDEYLVIVSDVTVNLYNSGSSYYTIENIGDIRYSRHLYYTIHPNISHAFTTTYFGQTSPIWTKGVSHLVLKDPSGNIIQEARF
jgi:hypothetical protein